MSIVFNFNQTVKQPYFLSLSVFQQTKSMQITSTFNIDYCHLVEGFSNGQLFRVTQNTKTLNIVINTHGSYTIIIRVNNKKTVSLS